MACVVCRPRAAGAGTATVAAAGGAAAGGALTIIIITIVVIVLAVVVAVPVILLTLATDAGKRTTSYAKNATLGTMTNATV